MTRFRFINTAILASLLCLSANWEARAAGCSQRAAQVAAANGGVLLSVVQQDDVCVVKLLVKPKKGPPVRRTVRVKK